MSYNYSLSIDEGNPKQFAVLWLILGLAALIIAGLFSILLVLSRTPFIQEIIPWVDFFHTALVVHVDMSVFIWFLAFAGILWSLTSKPQLAWLNKTAAALCAIGTITMAILPFVGIGKPLMNNYIPVLQHPVFYIALGLIGIGFTLLIIRTLIIPLPFTQTTDSRSVLHFGSYSAAIAALATMVAFLWTWLNLSRDFDAHAYFEYLFWGSGHILQFTHTQLMLICWLCLASASRANVYLQPRIVFLLLLLGVLPIVVTPYFYLTSAIDSVEQRIAFTRLMQYGGGLAAVPISIVLFAGLFTRNKATAAQRPLRASLISSLLLFSVGGILALLIEGVNVVIPAHYHGSIVGVTLAFMGVTYYLLPRLGYSAPSSRLAHLQPYIYGGGQLMHIMGLAWSGGYGVQRKTAGAAQGLDKLPEILGMAMMGLGGLIAIIGGLLFIIVAIKAMLNKTANP